MSQAAAVNELKERGNTAFKRKDFQAALKLYYEALALDPANESKTHHILLSNTAAVYMMTKDFAKALEFSMRATKVDPTFVRGWIRLRDAAVQCGPAHMEAALAAAVKVADLDPSEENLKTLVALRAYAPARKEGTSPKPSLSALSTRERAQQLFDSILDYHGAKSKPTEGCIQCVRAWGVSRMRGVWIPKDSPLLRGGELSPVMKSAGLPVRLTRFMPAGACGYLPYAHLDNQLATYLMVLTRDGLAPPDWQMNIGEVLIYREDGRPLQVAAVEGLWDYFNFLMDEYGEGDPRRARAHTTSSGFRRWLTQYNETQELNDLPILPLELYQ